MTLAFIDSGAWIALIVRHDSLHNRATQFFRSFGSETKLLTSNYVLSETITWLIYRGYRLGALQLQQMIDEAELDGRLTVAWVEPRIHAEAWRILRRYGDQIFSFCDCTSFAFCFQHDVDFVFGFDRDFRIVGLDLRPGS